jgi:formate dehydrogenase subunit gamma
MASESVRLVRRYLPTQRLVHWIGVPAFLVLLMTGIALLVPPFSYYAAGGTSRTIHKIASFVLAALPIVYVVFNPKAAKELLKESFVCTRDDMAWFKRMPAYFLGRTQGLPPQGRINAGQKLHHAATFFMFVTIGVSGWVLMFGKGQLGPDRLGIAAMIHDLSMLGLTVLMIGHLYFTFVYDALSGMLRGYVTEEYARMEHAKWLEELPENEFVVKK